MSFSIEIKSTAEHEFKNLSKGVQLKIVPELKALADNPFPAGYKKLKGGSGYRHRIGDYRVLYDIDQKNNHITISAIVHRKDAY